MSAKGGAQKARERRERLAAEAAARAAFDGAPAGPDAYRALGEPPGDPTLGLIYAQKAALLALREVMLDPGLPPRDRWRLIRELAFTVGATHAKALVQHKLDKVTKKLDAKGDVTGGPMPIGDIQPPPTSRAWKMRERARVASGAPPTVRTPGDHEE